MGTNFLTSMAIAFICFSENTPGLFGNYALVTALGSFLPVLDLGIGQSMYNHFTRRKKYEFQAHDFEYYVKYLWKISIIWISLVVTFYFIYKVLSLNGLIPFKISYSSEIIIISIIFYLSSIPFSAGFKLLNSIPKIELSLILQSMINPLVLFSLLIGRYLHLNLQTLVFIAPPLSFLLSNLMSWAIAKKLLITDSKDMKHNLHKPRELFVFGGWSTLMTITTILTTFLPRIVLQLNDEKQMLDEYSFFLTILNPFLSLISLYAMKIIPDFRKLTRELQLNWLISRIKDSLIIASLISILLITLVFSLNKLRLPTLGLDETVLALLIIFLYATYFIPLSAQSNLEDIKRFSILYLFTILLQVSLAFIIPNQNYIVFLIVTVFLSYVLQCLGVVSITLSVLAGKVSKW